MAIILDLPTEILWVIANTLEGHEMSALARTSRELYPKLRLALTKYNVRHQNSSALHWSAKTNNIDVAKILLSYQANINALVDDCSPLMTAVQYGSGSTFKLFLRNQNTNVNLMNKARKSVLWYSVKNNSTAVVKELLQHPDIKVDLLHCQRKTVLWLAVFHNNKELVAMLLSKGANSDAKDPGGISPWIQACINNRDPIKYLFLDYFKPVRPESKSEVCNGNAEMIRNAANNEDPDALQTRLRRGENVGTVDHQGRTALHLAAASGNISAVKLLLDKKPIDCGALDRYNSTPLHAAAKGGHLAVVDLLLRRSKASVKHKDIDGNTPLWWSTLGCHDDVAKRLLTEDDVDVNVVGGGGRYDDPSTSLHHAVSRRETVILQRLLAVPALDPNICAGIQSPLCLAIREGNTAALRLLLTHKDIQINAQYPHEDAPICLATERGNADAVKLLVEQGNRLKVNQLNKIDEETAVSVAVRNGSLYILHILLQHPGIDLNLRNRWGETALLIAVKRGDIELGKILLQDPRPISSLGIPAEVAKSCNNYVMENLIRGEIERKDCGSYDQAISLR